MVAYVRLDEVMGIINDDTLYKIYDALVKHEKRQSIPPFSKEAFEKFIRN